MRERGEGEGGGKGGREGGEEGVKIQKEERMWDGEIYR